jgi:glycosyltransferase involved in cell wall biosynthesis
MQQSMAGGEKMTTTPRLVYIMTRAPSAMFLRGHPAYMRERGFEVVFISAPGDELRIASELEGVTTVSVPMEREISPLKDLISLIRLYAVLRRLRPVIVNAGTPKAGLLGMIAACAARVPVRIYFLLGLRLETTRGLKRFVLGIAERCTSALAHRVICVSESLRRLYVRLGYTTEAKTCVPGKGSPSGIYADPNGLHPEEITQTAQIRERARALRAQLGIPDRAPVVGFAGRIARDKGVPELLDAFDLLRASFPDARLLMLGRFDDSDPIPESYLKRLRSDPRLVVTYVSNTAAYYRIMDVVAFPSYREGLAGPPLEAALVAEIPSVVFEATGAADAVCDGVTGTIVPLGDVASFACALERYVTNENLRREHGQAAYNYVRRYFGPEIVLGAIYEEYVRLLNARSRALLQKLITISEAKKANGQL